jgi:hypothetical protein
LIVLLSFDRTRNQKGAQWKTTITLPGSDADYAAASNQNGI